jgi:hypothetical protein
MRGKMTGFVSFRARARLSAVAAVVLVGALVQAASAATPVVTVTVSGRIFDAATGNGVTGMCVVVTSRPASASGNVVEHEAVTAADGRYSTKFSEVAGSAYSYEMSARPGCGASNWQNTWADGPTGFRAEPDHSSVTAP